MYSTRDSQRSARDGLSQSITYRSPRSPPRLSRLTSEQSSCRPAIVSRLLPQAPTPCLTLSRLGQCAASLKDYGTWGRPNPEHPPRKNREQNAFSIID